MEIVERLQQAAGRAATGPAGLRRYVGFISGAGSLVIAALYLARSLLDGSPALGRAFVHAPLLLLVVTGVAALASGAIRHALGAWLQVVLFTAVSLIVALSSSPGNVTSALFLILAIILCSEYATNTKVFAVALPSMIILYAAALASGYHAHDHDWLLGLATSLLLVLVLALLYGGLLLHHREKHREAAQLLESRVRERTAELEKALADRGVMLRELHHRVKNNLQIVASLLRLEASKVDDDSLRGPLEASIQRIHTMALVHDTLYQSEQFQHVELGYYTRRLVRAVSSNCSTSVRFELSASRPIEVDLDFAIPFGLLVNELVASATERVATPAGLGSVAVRLKEEPDLELTVVQEGGGSLDWGRPAGDAELGHALVRSLVRQLHGQAELSGVDEGRWLVTIPRRNGRAFDRTLR